MRHLLLAATLSAVPGAALAADDIPESLIAALRADLEKPITVIMLRAQNEQHAGLGQTEIDALDQTWRAEHEQTEQPLMAQLMGNPMTTYVTRLTARSGGLVSEIFVMDNKGLNVGQSSITSDYWQGDEAKYQQTFAVGSGAVLVDEVEVNEKTGHRFRQVSFTLSDPATGEPLGAASVDVNVDELERRR
jgi:hypothetical protein